MTKVVPQRRNANAHTPRGMQALETSIATDGWIGAITVAADGETFDGSARVEKIAENGMLDDAIVVETDGTRPVVVKRTDIPNADDPRAVKLGLAANRIAALNLAWEPDVLASIAQEIDIGPLWTAEEWRDAAMATDTAELVSDVLADDDEPPYAHETTQGDVLFASDNAWGVPTLQTAPQVDGLPMPVTRWGRIARHGASQMPGTWHFYTDDYKFAALWSDPTPIPFSGCRALIEPNVSTGQGMPAAIALWGIYRKRWIARWAQQYGIAIYVDLNVEPEFAALNLLGVPKGWRHYATRGYDARIELLDADYATAQQHANGEPVTFVVVGGGQATRAVCIEHGWVHVPQEAHEIEGRYDDGKE